MARTASENAHWAKLRALGCIVCHNRGITHQAAEIHHIRDNIDRTTCHMRVIPLCPFHHRTGLLHSTLLGRTGWDRWREVGYHQAPKEFERRYRPQRELLEQVNALVGNS